MAASVRDHQMFSGRGSARQDQDQGPPGFSNRGAEAPSPGTVPVDVNAPPVMDDGAEGEVLELEHMIGFTGKNLDTIIAHPRLSEVYVKSVGSAVVVGDLNDPHNQEFLRGHDMEVTALAVSATGAFIASGQAGTTHRKGFGAPVIVWDFETRRPLLTLQGHTEKVNILRFSPDEKFLAACGQDLLLQIWDLQTGELILGKKFKQVVAMFQWCDVNQKGRRNVYDIAIGSSNNVALDKLYFDPARQQWILDGTSMAMPTAGMTRDYLCSSRSADGDELLAGTSVGDLLVFKLTSHVYRASVPVCSGGLRAIVVCPTTFVIYCGGGDGTVRKLRGDDMRWTLEGEAALDGAVTSMSMVSNGTELLVGTESGRMYRMLVDDLSSQLVSVGHTAEVTCVCFGTRSDVFASASSEGAIKVWDLNNYSVLAETRVTAPGGARCMCWIGDTAVVSGWEDHFVRCHDASTMQALWEIPNAHRGAVTTVATHSDASLSYVLSGGEDGSVRIWALRSRELMLQFVEHKKGVSQVLVDVKSPNLVHSAGLDCSVFTYDLRKVSRTAICHCPPHTTDHHSPPPH